MLNLRFSTHRSVKILIVSVLLAVYGAQGMEAFAAPIQQYSGGLIVYADGSTGVPKYKPFDDTTGFGAEGSATAVGSTTIEWIRVAASPTRDEWIIVTRDAADIITAQVCTGTDPGVSCGATTTISATAGTHGLRNFDVAYEQSSGDALVVYGTATADELRKIEWNGTSWTGDAAITTTNTSGTVEWVELTSRPASDQIAIGYSDSNDDISAYRWSGSSAGNEATSVITASGSTGDVRKFDVSFEGTSGDMIVAAPLAGAGTTALGHMTSAGTWTIVANTEPDNITSYIDLQEVGADDDVAMVAYGTSTANNPTEGYELNGATPNTTTTGMVDSTVAVDTTTLTWVANYMPVSVAYLSSTYYAVAAFSDVTGADDINWWTMNSSGVWTVQADNTRTRGTTRFSDMFDYPNSDKVLLLSSDANSDLWADTWNGAATGTAVWTDVTSGGAVETALSSATTDVYDFAFRLTAVPVSTSISGTLYQADRTTTATSGQTIKLAIATTSTPTVLTATTTAGGVWSFSSIENVVTAATSGTPYTIWLDGTSTKATTLLMGNASSSAQGIHLYAGHLVVNGSTTVSAVNLQNFWAYDSTDDADIMYTISGTAATTTGNFFIRQGNFTPTATFAIAGDYTNNGTFTHGSGTVQFISTTTAQRLGGTLTGTSAFHNVQFAGTSTAYTRALGYWTFNSNAMTYSSATVGTSTDLSGNNHSGTLTNMSTTTSEVTGYIERGLYFDGTNDRISVSSSGSLDGLSTMTACAWIKPDSASTMTYPQIMSTYNSSETSGWDLYILESGADFGLGSSFWNSNSTYTFREYDNAVAADVWTHVCVKQSGDALANIALYVNGIRQTGDSTNAEAGTRVSDVGNNLNIGAHIIGAGDGYFRGVLDEVQVYDEYLTDTEIYDIYQTSSYYFSTVINGNASTTALTVASGTTFYATSSLTVFGDYTNSGTLISSSTSNFYLTGSGVTATGTMTGTSSFSNLIVSGAGTKTFGANASTTNFTVLSTSGEVVAPPALTVSGNYTNNSTTTAAGATWQAVSAAGNNDTWSNVIYAEGLFVTVSDGSDNRVMTSPDGITWTTRSAAGDNDYWFDVTYGNGLFVVVGPCASTGTSDCVMTSPDGITWTRQDAAGNNDYWQAVTYGDGLFVAVGDNGDLLMTSPDGITWTTRSAAGDNDDWYGITYGNGLFVAVGANYGGGDPVITSPDGITWTGRSAAGDNDVWRNVVYGNGLFVAVGDSGDKVMTSPDGITWTARSVAGNDDGWWGLTYGNGLFVATGIETGDNVMTSPDGINWTVRSAAGDNDDWYGVAYGDGRFVAVGSGPDVAMVSFDSALYVASSAAQTLSGNLTGASQLRSVTLSGVGTKTFSNNASTTDFTVASDSGEVLTPTALSVAGDYTNNATTSMVGATWTSRTASGNNDNWQGVTYGNGTFVAVGYGGDRIMTSSDGITWTEQSGAGDNDPWIDITYGNGLFVAVSDGSGGEAIMTSPDGVTWTGRSAAGNNDSWYGITYGNGLFVAVSYAGDRVMTSPDGTNWTVQSAAGNDDIWSDVTYGNGLFVAVGDGGADYVMTSPDGITWTARSAAEDNDGWIDIAYGNGLFVAVAWNGDDRIMTSPDGVTWTTRSVAGDNDQWWGVTYGDGLFVAVSKSGDRVMTSPDGVTWTVRSAAGDNDEWFGVTYGNSTFVAVSYTGGDSVITSTSTTLYLSGSDAQVVSGTTTGRSQLRSVVLQGAGEKRFTTNASTTDLFITQDSGRVLFPSGLTVSGSYANSSAANFAAAQWSGVQPAGNDDIWNGITYASSTFVAVGFGDGVSGGDRVMTSSDGLTWTARSAAGNDDDWRTVAYGKDLFVAVGDGADRVMTSPDGITWTARSAAGNDDSWQSIVYGNNIFVAVGGGVTGDRVMTSPDGITWTARSAAGDNDEWHDVTYGNGLFVAVGIGDGAGAGDSVMTSPDGITWTVRSVGGLATFWDAITYGNGLYVAVGTGDGAGGGDRVMTSPNGFTWTARSVSGGADDLYAVTYGNGLFVATGIAGNRVITSPDGINWTAESASGNDDNFYGAAYGNNRFVAVGDGGDLVLVAPDTTLHLNGSLLQTATGTMTGTSQLRSVILSGNGAKSFSTNASTTSFFNATSSSTTLPTALSVAGDYTNYGTIEAGSGTVYLTGAQPQTIRGTFTATSSFNNLYVKNYSPRGTTTFASAITIDGTLSADGGTYLALAAGATSTVATLTLRGSSTAPVSLGSTATGTKMNFVLTGTPTVTYTTIFDSDACGSTGGTIDVSGNNNTDGGNTSCWSFVHVDAASVALAANERFYVGQATTTFGTVTVTDDVTPTITTGGDIRLSIATTTTNFRFDVGVTSLTYGGTASGKVSNPVSYEDGGATLVIPVTSNFSANDTLTISGITVGAFGSVATTFSRLALHTDGDSSGSPADTSTETISLTGSLAVTDHDAGQATNKFSWQNQTEVTLYAFKLTPNSEQVTVTDLVVTLAGVQGVVADDLTNLKLYIDGDADGVYDSGETQVGGAGALTLNGQFGAITFSGNFTATTARSYVLIGDTTTIAPGAAVVFSLEEATGITTTGVTSGQTVVITGSVSDVQHIRNTAGGRGGGVSDRIGGEPPAGGGVQTGGGTGGGSELGDTAGGDNISPDVEFLRPTGTSTPSEWTNPQDAYASDGTSATAATNAFRQTFINFGFGIPSSNSIQGIAVKLDASGSTAAGTVDVALSWDGGSSYTSAKATPTLGSSDSVYTVGGPADTWGRSWSVGEFSNENFRLRVTANTSSNTLRLDGLEIRIYHQASGGGSGGGGGI